MTDASSADDPGAARRRDGRPWSGGGREELAAAIRRLAALCVTADPPAGVLPELASRIEAVAHELESTVPEPGAEPRARFADGRETGPSSAPSLAAAMPFDMVIGSCNPIAPPLVLEFDPPVARGSVAFAPPFEGAPGCVHGAVIAAIFDIMLTAANVVAGAAGPTVELRVRYRKPTLIDLPAEFEASVTSVKGRRVHSTGRLVQDGVVTVEAEGEFVNLPPERLDMIHRMGASRRKGGARPPTREAEEAGEPTAEEATP
ncbi:MAG: PaaI family thioesterase [Acidimicrobiales bacterium]|nr:PaaI family thioesterase [Acidimicrobiales bacterium]